MSKKIIENYQHKTGYHCGSTSMSSILNYYGINISEEMCFGLGSGLGFEYFPLPEINPPLYVCGRTKELEIDMLNNLQIEAHINSGSNYDEIFDIIKKRIDNDEPVVVCVDTYYLPYFKTRYYFPMHRIILLGYDDEEKIIYISDNEREEIQKVSYENFKKARISSALPIPTENRWFEIKMKKEIKSLNLAIKDALIRTSQIMLQDKEKNSGILGMKKFARDLKEWDKIFGDNWKEAAKFTYLMFEKFGTGGGNFRKIYSKFLIEAKDILQNDNLKKTANIFETIANDWQEFSRNIKEASIEDNFEKIIKLVDLINKILQEEENVYKEFLLIC